MILLSRSQPAVGWTRAGGRWLPMLLATILVVVPAVPVAAQESGAPSVDEVVALFEEVFSGRLGLDRGDVPGGFNPYFEFPVMSPDHWKPMASPHPDLTIERWEGDIEKREQGELAYEAMLEVGQWVDHEGLGVLTAVQVTSSRLVWEGMTEYGIAATIYGFRGDNHAQIELEADVRVQGRVVNEVRPRRLLRVEWRGGQFVHATGEIAAIPDVEPAIFDGPAERANQLDPRRREFDRWGSLAVIEGVTGAAPWLVVGNGDQSTTWLRAGTCRTGPPAPSGSKLVELDDSGRRWWLAYGRDVAVYAFDGENFGSEAGRIAGGAGTMTDVLAFDADGDGDRDLLVTTHPTRPATSSATMPWPLRDPRNGTADRFFSNEGEQDGQWSFVDRTNEWGLGFGNDRWSTGAIIRTTPSGAELVISHEFGPARMFEQASQGWVERWDCDNPGPANVRWIVEADFDLDGERDRVYGVAGSGRERCSVQSASSMLAPRVVLDLLDAAKTAEVEWGGQASVPTLISGTVSTTAAAVGDLFSIGRPQLLISNQGPRQADWTEALGVLAREGQRPEVARSFWRDLDHGRKDWMLSRLPESQLLVFLEDRSTLDLAPLVRLQGLQACDEVVFLDWDLDGDLDVATLGREAPALRLYLNDLDQSSDGPPAPWLETGGARMSMCEPGLAMPPLVDADGVEWTKETHPGRSIWLAVPDEDVASEEDIAFLKGWARAQGGVVRSIGAETPTAAWLNVLTSWVLSGSAPLPGRTAILIEGGQLRGVTQLSTGESSSFSSILEGERPPLRGGFEILLRHLRESDAAAEALDMLQGHTMMSGAVRLEAGRCALQVGRNAEAIGFLEGIRANDEDYGAAQLELARAHLRFRNAAGAQAAFEQAARLRPFDPQVFFEFGRFLNSKGDVPGAEKTLHRALYLGLDSYEFLTTFARVLTAAGWIRHAVEVCDQAQELRPESGEPPFLRGQAHHRLEQYEEATASFEEAMKTEGPIPLDHVRWWLARTALDSGDAKKAGDWLDQLEAPDDASMLEIIGSLRREIDRAAGGGTP